MQQWIIQIVDQFGYWGILFLVAIENIFPPIPSEVILTFGGFMTSYTNMTIPLVILAATGGSVFGAVILYGIGRLLPPAKLEHWIDGKIGRTLHFKKGDVLLARQKFEKKGQSAVFFGRCIPIVRSLISIPAGMAGMSFIRFMIFTILGTVVWNTVLVSLGAIAGHSWERIAGYFDTFSTITLIVILAALAVLAYLFYRKRFVMKNQAAGPKTDDQDSDLKPPVG